jgi:hypothetical protein
MTGRGTSALPATIDAADEFVARAGDFNDLGAILRARRRSVGAASSLSSRRVKFASAFVKRRQVLSSFVKFCQALSRLSLTGRRAISNIYGRHKLTSGPLRKCLAA